MRKLGVRSQLKTAMLKPPETCATQTILLLCISCAAFLPIIFLKNPSFPPFLVSLTLRPPPLQDWFEAKFFALRGYPRIFHRDSDNY